MGIGIFLELSEIGLQVSILNFWPALERHQVGVKSLIVILVKRAYSESMPKSHDPFTIIPKLCESVGKEYYKIGLE